MIFSAVTDDDTVAQLCRACLWAGVGTVGPAHQGQQLLVVTHAHALVGPELSPHEGCVSMLKHHCTAMKPQILDPPLAAEVLYLPLSLPQHPHGSRPRRGAGDE